jgi:hypothetical protein
MRKDESAEGGVYEMTVKDFIDKHKLHDAVVSRNPYDPDELLITYLDPATKETRSLVVDTFNPKDIDVSEVVGGRVATN